MIVLPPVTTIRPADNIAAMLRALADDVEAGADILNLFIVIEHEDEDDADVRVFGPCDDPYRVAGFLTKGARDVLP
jgi:hypothetical protein